MSSSTIIEVRQSPVHGHGVFALAPIPAGTRIIEYTGRHLGEEELDDRIVNPDDPFHTFLFVLDSGRVIDAAQGGSDARWINHSCAPNCRSLEEDEHVFIEAMRDIQAGEELTYDYKLDLDAEQTLSLQRSYECRCGAVSCRRTMLGEGRPVSETRFALLPDQDQIILQALDSTGSAAALATLLTYQHGIETSEREIAEFIAHGTPVSLLDLKRFVALRGFRGTGYARLDLAGLVSMAPALVQVDLGRGSHFSVFRGAVDDTAYLADPAYGNISLPLPAFLDTWQSRAAFVVTTY